MSDAVKNVEAGVAHTDDEQVLAGLGYKQELKRDFGWVETLGLGFSIIGVVQSIAATLVYSIPNGGAVSMVWGWAVCSVFFMLLALAMAELGSAAPTSGGLYYWTFIYSSPKYRNVLSWLVGYVNTIAFVSGLASVDYALAVQIYAAVTIGSSSETPFIPTSGQIYGLYLGLLVSHVVAASLATKIIARLQMVYIVANVGLFLAIIIALPVATPDEFKNSASYVFGNFQNFTIWPSGFAFMLSFLAPTWSVGGFDSGVHMSEEVKNANVAVPRAIVGGTGLGCLLGWICNIVIALNMGNQLDEILANPIGQPMATILFNSLGQKGVLAIWSCIIIVLYMSCMNYLIAGSRQVWAFSRDGALPFSQYLKKVNPYTQTPVAAVCFLAVCSALVCLLTFAGPAATVAVFTMPVVCQYIAYSIPIIARFIGAGQEFVPGPFTLGKLGLPVAVGAVSFMLFISTILLFPTGPNPTAENMNYSVVVVGGTLFLSLVYYYFPKWGGQHWFKGPVVTIEDSPTSISESSSSDYVEKEKE